jgi:adenylate cyclase
VEIRLGISTKLIFMVTLIVVSSIGAVVYVASDLFREESLTRVQEMNKDVAEGLAEQVYSVLKGASDKMAVMTETLSQVNGRPSIETQQLIQNVLRSTDDLISFGVYQTDAQGAYQEIYFAHKEEVLAELDISIDQFRTIPINTLIGAVRRRPDAISIVNTSPLFKKPLLSVAFLSKETAQKKPRWLVRCEIRQEPLVKLFQKKSYMMSYMVDADGSLLVHSDPKLVLKNYNFSVFPIVQKLKEGQLNNHQMSFEDEEGYSYIGAFKMLGIGGAGVVAQVETEQALKAVMRVQYRALLVTAIVVGLALILNFLFSESITSPLGALYLATEKVAQGDFDIRLPVTSSDEIGALTFAFKKMTAGLQERDKLKATFSKFHSKEIAQKILSGEIRLGGERKLATIFFSDIRDFTTMSEKMNPDEVLSLLNEYMTEMVNIINQRNGVVDKYVGDAIMALWGVPNSTANDAENAVTAALEMRKALNALNEKRRNRNQPEIRIGIGIHTGEVLAGNMGSNERLEYTVLGDNVNQASRIESANKELSSDILISDTTYALVRDKGFVVGPPVEIKVKGKAKKLTVHQIIGKKDASGNLESTLSEAERQAIMRGPAVIAEDSGTPVPAHTATGIFQFSDTQVAPMPGHGQTNHGTVPQGTVTRPPIPVTPPEDLWYLVRDSQSQNVEGPYTSAQIRVVTAQAGFPFDRAYVYREGDSEMTPLTQMGIFTRRGPPRGNVPIHAPPPATTEPAPHEWYVYGDENNTYGPYSIEQIREGLAAGNISTTTYCWSQSVGQWIFVHQIPGFDRRAATSGPAPGMAPLAIPLSHIRRSG